MELETVNDIENRMKSYEMDETRWKWKTWTKPLEF